ncbi:MAG: zf-HC2 domain-containing protein [Pyrinomonadaceae bacterium]
MNTPTATIENFCSQRSEIAAYIDGELLPREELELETHFVNCKSCAAELNEQKKLFCALDFALEGEREIVLPINFTRVVVANAESKVSGLRRPQERSKALFVCAALFLLTLVFLGAETDILLNTFWKFTEQFLAVGSFAWNLVYDIAIGAAVILRSVCIQLVSNSSGSVAILIGLFFVSLLALSRLMTRYHRP